MAFELFTDTGRGGEYTYPAVTLVGFPNAPGLYFNPRATRLLPDDIDHVQMLTDGLQVAIRPCDSNDSHRMVWKPQSGSNGRRLSCKRLLTSLGVTEGVPQPLNAASVTLQGGMLVFSAAEWVTKP